MKRVLLIGLAPLLFAAPASAQPMDHSSMGGLSAPGAPPKKTPAKKAEPRPAKPGASAQAARARSAAPSGAAAPSSPHNRAPGAAMDPPSMPGMNMPPAAAHDHAGMSDMAMPRGATPMDHASMPGMTMAPGAAPMDHSAMPGMSMAGVPAGPPLLSAVEAPTSPPPPPPRDAAADRYYDPALMAKARAQLRREHGGGAAPYSKVMTNLFEHQSRSGADGYRWDGQAWFGGDIHRLVLRSEGEGTRGEAVDAAEVQALYSRAVGVYTDVQAGVRQDFAPHDRTYAAIGFETLFPYWFDIEGAAFISTKGELLGRLEGNYDLRLTNRWILQPRAELNFAAQDTRETRTGSGLSNAELGLRLRYEIRREFAPYVGVSWDRQFGKTADYARALGESPVDKSVVFGVRAFF